MWSMRRFLRRLFRRGPESSPSSTRDEATFASTESRDERENVLKLSAEASGGDSMRTMLFLAANPDSMATLDLDSERRAIELSLHLRDPARMIQENAVMAEQFAIEECMQRAPGQHTLRVVAETAVTDDDLRRALLKHEPDIVHFSGHGAGKGGLVFEEAGEALFISGDALDGLLGLCSKPVRCVVLNACYSEVQAQSISSVVDYVIGMSRAIGDIAAIKFSAGFYDAVAAGRSFTDAFRYGCNAISLRGIPESLTPTLLIKDRVRSTDIVRVGESQSANVRQVGGVEDPSLKELISILDFRADVILSAKESSVRDASDVAGNTEGNPERDMHKLGESKTQLDENMRIFAELHEQNKRALLNGEFVLSHEITRRIQQLLSKMTHYAKFMYIYSIFKAQFFILPHSYAFARVYPGPLPESVKNAQNQAVLMWEQQEAEERRAAEGARREHRRQLEERQRQRTEWSNQRETVKLLQVAAKAKGILKEGDRCPKCGFSYAWVGTECYHCQHGREQPDTG
jgi:hypothetical protein